MSYLLPEQEKFPINNPSDVVHAADYFEKYAEDKSFSPKDKRIFCSNLAKLQAAIGLTPSEKVATYAGKELDGSKVAIAIGAREVLLEKEAGVGELLRGFIKSTGSVDSVLDKFLDFDKGHGLDRLWGAHIPDPMMGLLKPGEREEKPQIWTHGPDSATEEQIIKLSRHRDHISGLFSDSFVDSFVRNPMGSIGKLSDYEKGCILRMARDLDAAGDYY